MEAPEELEKYETEIRREITLAWARRGLPRPNPYSGRMEKPPGGKWDAHGLGKSALQNVFHYYLDTKRKRLDSESIAEKDYTKLKADNRSYLTSPEIRIYDALVQKLEELMPDVKWKDSKGDTKIREKAPA